MHSRIKSAFAIADWHLPMFKLMLTLAFADLQFVMCFQQRCCVCEFDECASS